MTGARDHALAQLDAIRLPGWPIGLIKRHLPPPRDARDLALAEQIRVGVIKNLLWLQVLTEHHSGRNAEKIDPLVRKIIAVGLYQLRFLTRVPPRAAVDEAVEQARRHGHAKAAGFVNAVLRNATRNPDPDDVPEAVKLSHPALLYQRILRLTEGDEEAALALCRRHNDEPPLIVRLAPGRSTIDLAADAPAGVTVRPHAAPGMAVVEGATRALLADWGGRGVAQVQDPTSAAVVALLDVQPGQTVLDRCCGVGTKTMQLSDLVGPGGRVFAIDPNADRCQTLRDTLARRGCSHVGVIEAGWIKPIADVLPRQFDRVLVDAPCGNSGVLIRRAEARYHQSAGAIRSLTKLQKDILADTAPLVGSGGLLVYSTCSLWPEENDRVADWFAANHDDFVEIHRQTTLPTTGRNPIEHHDGGFAVAFRRR